MKHTVVHAGLGGRGKIHLNGILQNAERFELRGVFDPSPEAVKSALTQFNLSADLVYPSAEAMLEENKPEVLVFITQPEIRHQYVEMGIRYGVKCISFEKPMSVSLEDARVISKLCADNHVKAVVSHQQKYMWQQDYPADFKEGNFYKMGHRVNG
jgi:predicted dehydrogenase